VASHTARAREQASGGVTRRAIVIAFLLLAALCVAAFYAAILWSDDTFTNGVPAPAQLSLLFLLCAAMGLPVLRRRGLTRRELLTIYSILLVGSPLVSRAVLYYMVPKVVAYYYLARAHPLWETSFLPLVPSWFAPSNPAAAESFFGGNAAVPWPLWWTPLAVWSSYLLALVVATSCLLIILQRQWITNERLSFPIAQIPLTMIRERNAAGGVGRLATGPAFRIGVAVALLLGFVDALALRFPSIPAVPLGPITLIQWQKVGPLAGLGAYELVLWPWLIALAFLIPKELSFSCWFFWLVRVGLTVLAIAAGETPQRPEEWWASTFPAPYYQGTGAVLALGLWTLWIARRHLAFVARTAFSSRSGRDDAREPIPYRWAVVGFVLSVGWLLWFLLAAGGRAGFAVAVLALILGHFAMWARLRAETGLGLLAFPQDIAQLMLTPFGAGRYSARELVVLFSLRWSYCQGEGETLDTTTGNLMDTFKIADAAEINVRRLTVAIAAGFVLALGIGLYVVLAGTYHYGYFATKVGAAPYYPSLHTRMDPAAIYENITNPLPADLGAVAAMVAGGIFTVALGLLRLRFHWWPLHPVGYLAANCWGWNWYLTPFFLGWSGKVLVTRYGGLRLYRATVPLAVGLIVGTMLNRGLWAIITLVARGPV